MNTRAKGGRGLSGFVRNYNSREQAILILATVFILSLLLVVQLYVGFHMNLGIADQMQTDTAGTQQVGLANIGPIFRCATNPTFRRKKLVFTHVFKNCRIDHPKFLRCLLRLVLRRLGHRCRLRDGRY